MRKARTGLVAVCLLAVPLAAQEARSPHDVTNYPVVYRVPSMDAATVRSGLAYATGDAGPVRLDLYLPPPGTAVQGPLPVVLFANGVGDFGARKLKDWEIYRTWARLMAAHGVAAATMEAEGGRTAERIGQAVDYLRREAGTFGLDANRVGLWACSGNVTPALPYAMGGAPLKAAVFYYGYGDAPTLRADLPVLYVMAGKDSPSLNEGIQRLWVSAAQQRTPWTMVSAPAMPHAFDGLVETRESRDIVRDTVEFLRRHLAPAEPAKATPLAQQALAHSYGWEWERAADAYGRIVAADPKDRDARRQYGRVLVRAGRGKEAVKQLHEAIALGEEGPGVRLDLANVLLADRQYEAAVAAYDEAIARGGPAGVSHYNAACALALGGNKEAALARLEKAVAAGFGPRSAIEADDDLASLRADPRFAAIVARTRS